MILTRLQYTERCSSHPTFETRVKHEQWSIQSLTFPQIHDKARTSFLIGSSYYGGLGVLFAHVTVSGERIAIVLMQVEFLNGWLLEQKVLEERQALLVCHLIWVHITRVLLVVLLIRLFKARDGEVLLAVLVPLVTEFLAESGQDDEGISIRMLLGLTASYYNNQTNKQDATTYGP